MDVILGIDLGTTNSVAGIIRDGQVEVLKEDGEALLPSVVGFDEEGRLLVGASARNQWVMAPERTVRSIKRQMGQDVRVRLGSQEFTPQEISAMILRELRERASRQLGRPITKAVITVPALFNEIQREATREAGKLAGLDVVRIINEPTAASLAYEANHSGREHLLVYDLGGGTFDCSIVQIEKGVVEVLASHGDTRLGGDDFDQLLFDHVCDRFRQENDVDMRESLVAKARVLRAVEQAKKTLSFEEVVRVQEEFIAEKGGLPLHLDLEITRPEYEDLIEPWILKTLVSVDEALSDSKLSASRIDKVILVGGASRTPLVHRLLAERLDKPLHSEVDPDLAVAAGAAVQGGLIAGLEVGPVLVDITPRTLGIRVAGYRHGMQSVHCFGPLIERNTALPASRSKVFATMVDGQEAAVINIFQGENADVRHNEQVGEFLLEGLADVDAGNEILVRFDLDLNGILNVTARERATGNEKGLTIDNSVHRFRSQSSDAAQARLESLFERAASGGPGPVPTDDSDLPESLRPLVQKARELMAKAERLLADPSCQDADEIRQCAEDLRSAIAAREADRIESAMESLENLVFYLQDA